MGGVEETELTGMTELLTAGEQTAIGGDPHHIILVEGDASHSGIVVDGITLQLIARMYETKLFSTEVHEVDTSSKGSYPQTPLVVVHHVIHIIAAQRPVVLCVVMIMSKLSIGRKHEESLTLRSYPQSALNILIKGIELLGEVDTLLGDLTATIEKTEASVVGIEDNEESISCACPCAPVSVGEQGAHLIVAHHRVHLEVVISETELTYVFRSCEPEVLLLVNTIFYY